MQDLRDPMTIEEFLAFTADRPEGERWELVEGRAVMNPSPTSFHQIIAGNINTALSLIKEERAASWVPLLGVGTRVPASPNSLPQPDVMVFEHPPLDSPVSEDALVLFEVLSRSNTRKDQAWRRRVYASIPNCAHYVTVSLRRVQVVAHDRSSGWAPRTHSTLEDCLALPALGASLPLSLIYRWTPFAAKPATSPASGPRNRRGRS